MKRLTYILFLVCLLGCVACRSKSMTPTLDQFTISATNTDSQVDFEGYIDYQSNSVEGKTIVPSGNLGVMISTNSDMSDAKEYRCFRRDDYYGSYDYVDSVGISFSNQNFYRTVYNLPNGTYYYCAYADAPYSTRLTTDVQSIVVANKEIPTFCDVAIFSNVKATSFNISYRFKDLGDYPITEHGLCYNKLGKSYTPLKTSRLYGSPSVETIYSYESPSEITSGTKYYFWAYAVTSKGTFYSNEWVIQL